MKRAKLWAIVVLAVIIASGTLMAFALEPFKVIPIEPPKVERHTEPPENATVIANLKSIPFELSLDASQITVSKGQSFTMTVTVYSTEKVDLLLMVGTEDYVPTLAPELPKLPPGITARFDRTEISVEAISKVNVNLTLSIRNQAKSGTYTLQIFAIQKTSHGSVAVGVPLQLSIP